MPPAYWTEIELEAPEPKRRYRAAASTTDALTKVPQVPSPCRAIGKCNAQEVLQVSETLSHAVRSVLDGTHCCEISPVSLEEELSIFSSSCVSKSAGNGDQLNLLQESIDVSLPWADLDMGVLAYARHLARHELVFHCHTSLAGNEAWSRLLEEVSLAVQTARPSVSSPCAPGCPDEAGFGVDSVSRILLEASSAGCSPGELQTWGHVLRKSGQLVCKHLRARVAYAVRRVGWLLQSLQATAIEWMSREGSRLCADGDDATRSSLRHPGIAKAMELAFTDAAQRASQWLWEHIMFSIEVAFTRTLEVIFNDAALGPATMDVLTVQDEESLRSPTEEELSAMTGRQRVAWEARQKASTASRDRMHGYERDDAACLPSSTEPFDPSLIYVHALPVQAGLQRLHKAARTEAMQALPFLANAALKRFCALWLNEAFEKSVAEAGTRFAVAAELQSKQHCSPAWADVDMDLDVL